MNISSTNVAIEKSTNSVKSATSISSRRSLETTSSNCYNDDNDIEIDGNPSLCVELTSCFSLLCQPICTCCTFILCCANL